MKNNTLRVENLSKNYGSRTILKDISLEANTGESVGLLGPNGAGKTTAFYCITGQIAATGGKIFLNRQDITHLPFYQRAKLKIGYLPQENSVFRGLSVEQNIMAVLEISETNKSAREDRLNSLLKEFSIDHLRKAPATSLSGGERRRVEIARSLASKPSFILLDEPFAGIDPIAVGDIRELVSQLKERGLGVIITDHNVRETLGITDRSYVLHDGFILKHGTTAEIVKDPQVRKVYLGEEFRM
ncbi:MAG: LPS export ABC transporter ATP-binding protein [Rickettsiales bacterium]|jgi:lipopolysaccharide export system ATP-binding protein|nr:LPS export ABC transporter ATP-binding protein [Rickettsiales bacterium]